MQSKSKRLDRFEVVVVSNIHNAPAKLLLSSTSPASNVTQLALGWLAKRNPGYFYQSKFDIFYPFCESSFCRTLEDKHYMKNWETWFLFEDKNTGDFKNQSCHYTSHDERQNVDDCIERFHYIIKNQSNPFNRGIVFTKHYQIADLGYSEEDESRLFLQYKHNSVYQMLGRWIQNRTGDFGDNVSDDETSPIPLEGVVTKKRMDFVFGWVHKLIQGTA